MHQNKKNVTLYFLMVITMTSFLCDKKNDTITNSVKKINGTLETVNGVSIIRLWGSHREMGYAYGYLLADELTDVINEMLFDYLLENYSFEAVVDKMNQNIIWPSGYQEEMVAVIEGMKAKLGTLPVITHKSIRSGSMPINTDMLAVLNSSRDLVDMDGGCSAFAVWGDGTDDGQTRAGGNSDRAYDGDILSKYTIIVVRKPDYGLSSVTTFFISALGFSRGMNEKGVICCPTGVTTGPKSTGQCSPLVALRDIMEQTESGPDMVDDIIHFFDTNRRCGANSILFAQGKPFWPNPTDDQMAVIIECDYNGVTGRLPSYNSQINTPFETAIITTNEYLQREGCLHSENSAQRYAKMSQVFQNSRINSLTDMQTVLQASQQTNTIISLYAEPDSKKIHVAFHKTGDPPSPSMAPIPFTWDELFSPVPE